MKRQLTLKHQFVEYIPDAPEDGTIYVSIPFATAIHKCCCGCGNQVVTPLSPTDWKLVFDGVSVSLDPSIGNWSFPCQSHYWIKRNTVTWAPRWSSKEIEQGRAKDRRVKSEYFDASARKTQDQPSGLVRESIWQKIKRKLAGSN
ncbi:MAG: hypothetical protein HYU53_02090 [Acidobacteria bacterium]|nr:hypothetical protein [Acidobacteriota bacterium]